MIVDVNQHWSPPDLYEDRSFMNQYLRSIPKAYGEHVVIRDKSGTSEKEISIQRPKGYENLSADFKYHHGSEDRLKAMDKTGVDKAILRWPSSPEWLTLEICKRANDAMAKTVKASPDRLMGLAIVPPWGDEDCLAELDRCINELGCVGVDMQAHYGTLYLDAEEFRPYLQKINELNVPIIVHHVALPVDYNSVYDYTNLRRMFGRCIDQMTCAGRILYSGILEELPNLKFIHTMMAGGLFTFADLITPEESTVKEDRERFEPLVSDKVRGYMKKNIYLDITHAPPWGKAQLECAVRVMGAKNILFGSSFPLRSEWLYKGPEYIKSLNISEEEKSLILGGNGIRLFKI